MIKKLNEDKFSTLRRQAEYLLQSQPTDLTNLSAVDIPALIRNLQHHQIELELQIEELRRAHLDLEVARDRYVDLYNLASVGYFTLDVNGAIVEVNLAGETLLNVTDGSLLGSSMAHLVAPEDQDKYAGYQMILCQDQDPQKVEIKLIRQAEEPFYAQLEGVAAYDQEGRFLHSHIIVSDISERVKTETVHHESEQLTHSNKQLRELSARLQVVREEERTRISRVIHDELGQTLTGLRIDVAWLQSYLNPSSPLVLSKIQAMGDLIDTTVQTVRRISTELRPSILDISLIAAIEWQLQEFQTRLGIQGILLNAPEETTLSADDATTVFRIFQEILTNITRHAQATQVTVSIEETDTFLTLQVKDNGRGITESEINSPKSIGLLGMKERARLRLGEVHFQGKPGEGTTVTVRLPLVISEPLTTLETSRIINVLIADDHPIVRQGLRQILSSIPDMKVAGEATNAQETLDHVRGGDWDVLILDITLPDRSGFDILKELKYEQPHLPILILSIHSEEQLAIRALKAGASGYLTKENAPTKLVEAIRKVVDGGKYISSNLAEALAFGLDTTSVELRHETLSDREFQVMQLIAGGKTLAEIAEKLILSPKTVSTYRARLLEKMNLKTNSEIIRYAFENGLIE